VKKDKTTIYCDGACSGNQFKTNKGGWGAILQHKDKTKEIYGGQRNTTNQRMELTACIKALEEIEEENSLVEIYSDSAYLIQCMHQKWYERWQKNGWLNYKKKPVENKDLWMQLLDLVNKHSVTFYKVSGHSGVELNELSDSLARQGMSEVD
jgi:ribonuclease HI